MKFFTVSFFILIGSAILGGSSATPAQKHHILGGVLGLLDNTLNNLLESVDKAVSEISEAVRTVLNQLTPVAEKVVDTVRQLLEETGKGLIFVADRVVDNILTLVAKVTDGLITIEIDIDNLEIYIGGRVVATINEEDGSIVGPDGNIIGYFDPKEGILVAAGKFVDELLSIAGHGVRNENRLVSNLLQTVGGLVGDILKAVENAVNNITPALRAVLDKLPLVTDEIVNLIEDILQETDEALVGVVEGLTNNNILTFRQANGKCLISVDLGTLTVTVNGQIIGTYDRENGSIVDSQGNLIGVIDSVNGVLLLVGDIVGSLLCIVGDVLDGVGGVLGGLLGPGGVLDNLL